MGRGSYQGGSTVIGPGTRWRESDRTIIKVVSKPPTPRRHVTQAEIDRLAEKLAAERAALAEKREARRLRHVEKLAQEAERPARPRKPKVSPQNGTEPQDAGSGRRKVAGSTPATPRDPGLSKRQQEAQDREERAGNTKRVAAAAAGSGGTLIEYRRGAKSGSAKVEVRAARKIIRKP